MDDNQTVDNSTPANQFSQRPINDGLMGIDDSQAQDDTSVNGNLVVDHVDEDEKSDLVRIRKDALNQLAPLVDHIDQTPEEKFHTTMMMIQASDDKTLVQTAYDAASKIEDDKKRAEALLDIVNEINYFTHSKK